MADHQPDRPARPARLDKKNGSTDDKLEEARKKLADLIRAKGDVDPNALAREQQQLLQMLTTIQQQVQKINDVNQSVTASSPPSALRR